MWHDIILFVIGLALIVAGGNYLTDGAVAIAEKFKVSPLIIGLTVVAFGSSTPDLVVCLMSTFHGKTGLAVGDIVGANIFDILMVVGITAIIHPVVVSDTMRKKDIPILLISALILFYCADDRLLDGSGLDIIGRGDGLVLLTCFAIFMYVTIRSERRNAAQPVAASQSGGDDEESAPSGKKMPMWLAAVCVAGGLAALVFGGDWLVDGASGIAREIGMSEAVIGLTVVGIGSSLPDLATSAIAAMKRQTGLALGNVVGACIFNIFFIIGACSTIRPLTTQEISFPDFGTLIVGSALLLVFTLGRKRAINRVEGVVLVAAYVAYMVYLLAGVH